ncbi:MAG: helix-turn-helix domain-containing protein [Planctomycetota bacterium]
MNEVLSNKIRSEAFFRSYRSGSGASWIDCGVLAKTGPRQGYRDRVVADRFVVIYVLRGQGLYIDGRCESHTLGPGDVVPHVPGRPHSIVPEPDGQWVEFFMQLPAVFFRALCDMGHLPDSDQTLQPGLRSDLTLGYQQLMDAAREADEPDAPRLLSQAHDLLLRFYRSEPSGGAAVTHQPAIEAACEALSGVDADHVDLSALAEEHGLSYERLRKLFRQSVGLPPGEYRIRRRIDRARAMIAERGQSNKAIAFALGYADPFAFSKQFKKYVGVSPSVFRRRL